MFYNDWDSTCDSGIMIHNCPSWLLSIEGWCGGWSSPYQIQKYILILYSTKRTIRFWIEILYPMKRKLKNYEESTASLVRTVRTYFPHYEKSTIAYCKLPGWQTNDFMVITSSFSHDPKLDSVWWSLTSGKVVNNPYQDDKKSKYGVPITSQNWARTVRLARE